MTAYDASGLPGPAFSGTFALPDRTTMDQRAPRLTHFRISSGAVDLRAAPATVQVSLGVSDDRPGITGTIRISDPAGFLLARHPLSCLTDVLTPWAASFPCYTPRPAAVHPDTDGDGTADLMELVLGTDPSRRSVSPDRRSGFNTGLEVHFPFRVQAENDPRSHRFPSLSHSGQAASPFGDPAAPPWTNFSYTPSPRMKTGYDHRRIPGGFRADTGRRFTSDQSRMPERGIVLDG